MLFFVAITKNITTVLMVANMAITGVPRSHESTPPPRQA